MSFNFFLRVYRESLYIGGKVVTGLGVKVVKGVIAHWGELGVKVICFVDSYPKTDSHKTIGFFTLHFRKTHYVGY